jgi:uncharacterized repeat protein (TIGR03803 family)
MKMLSTDQSITLTQSRLRDLFQISRPSSVMAATCMLVAPIMAHGAPTETLLYSFRGNIYGDSPILGTLIQDGTGILYGTASGERSTTPRNAKGVIYTLTPPTEGSTAWIYKPIYKFTASPTDGYHPTGGLTMDPQGNLYGTTVTGIIYELSPPTDGGTQWSEQTLINLNGQTNNTLLGGLLRAKDGTLYGVISGDGSNNPDGALFSLTPPTVSGGSWTYKLLHTFLGASDGYYPTGVLTQDVNGNLYGTTSSEGPTGFGTVFELSPPQAGQTTWSETILYAFKGGATDGQYPIGGLLLGTNGALYGTTSAGDKDNNGDVYELTPPVQGQTKWAEKIIHKFADSGYSMPLGSLAGSPNGDIYGTTSRGPNGSGGSVFRLTPPPAGAGNWGFKLLFNFPSYLTGATPEGAVLVEPGSKLFGTTYNGGLADCAGSSCGVIYEITQ